MSQQIMPKKIGLEASSICQLRCPSCPNSEHSLSKTIGKGFLQFRDFRKLLDENSQIREIELSNNGEIFLNPELLEIIKLAYERGIALTADNGVNLNDIDNEMVEGLVKYKFRRITVSIDGANDETYKQYRIGGNYEVVIENIRKINRLKKQYRSKYPLLAWQFIIFGFNAHEIVTAQKLANELNMYFYLKLPWAAEFSPVQNQKIVRKELGAVSRKEYKEKYGVDYTWGMCHQLWEQPQLNWDGRVLGCLSNIWRDFGGNAFNDGLFESVNNEKMNYARDMLIGRQETREDIPCAACQVYLNMRSDATWLERRLKKRFISSIPFAAKRAIKRKLNINFCRRYLNFR